MNNTASSHARAICLRNGMITEGVESYDVYIQPCF